MPNPGDNGLGSEVNQSGSAPLPQGWDVGRDFDGKIYYIDHNSKKTTWTDPRAAAAAPSLNGLRIQQQQQHR